MGSRTSWHGQLFAVIEQRTDSTRDERRLAEVREKLHTLRVTSRDDFNLPARYRALVKLETIIRGRVKQERAATR
jgi:hypothetical protein